MKTQRLGLVLTVINLCVLGVLVTKGGPPLQAQSTPGMLRGQGLEIVDAQGQVRASITVFAEEKAPDGSTIPETVLLRLITDQGRPAVKISASDKGGSGLSLAGPSGTHQTYVTIGAKERSSTFKLKNEDGRERTIAP